MMLFKFREIELQDVVDSETPRKRMVIIATFFIYKTISESILEF